MKQTDRLLSSLLDGQKTILDSANISIIAINENGIIVSFNRAAERMLGYREDEVVGKSAPELFHDKDEIAARFCPNGNSDILANPSYLAIVAETRSGIPDEREWTYIRKDGSRFRVSVSITPLYDAEGSLIGYLKIAIDITARKEIENQLKKSESFTRSVLDALSKHFYVLDREGNVLAENKPWMNVEEQFNQGNQQVEIGQNYLSYLESGQADDKGGRFFSEGIRSVLQGDIARFSHEYSFHTPFAQVWFTGTVIPFPDHTLGDAIVIYENISARKQLEYRFHQAVESAPNALVMVDNSGKIVMVNTQTETYFGYPRTELIEQQVEILIPNRFREAHAGFRHAYFKAPSSRPMGVGRDLYGLRKDGTEFPLEIGLGVIDNEQGPLVLASIIDITERKNASDKLMQALNEKELLLKEVYHRVKNNLQVVSSLINLQARHVKNEATITLLKQSADRIKAMALLHEKLYQSKDLARIEFRTYVQNLVDHLSVGYNISSERITVNMQVDNVFLDVDTAIPCGLIINELLSNAFKHAFPDARRGEICITFKQDQHESTLKISDNGIGFTVEQNHFDNTLGLQLVSALSQQLMGEITWDQNDGTIFVFSFPYNH